MVAVRRAVGTDDEVLAVVNVSDETVSLETLGGTDLLSGERHDGLELPPFGYVWLAA